MRLRFLKRAVAMRKVDRDNARADRKRRRDAPERAAVFRAYFEVTLHALRADELKKPNKLGMILQQIGLTFERHLSASRHVPSPRRRLASRHTRELPAILQIFPDEIEEHRGRIHRINPRAAEATSSTVIARMASAQCWHRLNEPHASAPPVRFAWPA